MKLREILRKLINEKTKSKLQDFIQSMMCNYPSTLAVQSRTTVVSTMAKIIDEYLDINFLTKNEAAHWLQTVDLEFQELRETIEEQMQRIEELEEQQASTLFQYELDQGLDEMRQDYMDFIDQMIADEYQSNSDKKPN